MHGPITREEYIRTVPCVVCNTINNRRRSRLCDSCYLPHHLTCVNLTKKLSAELRRWLCLTCRNGNNNGEAHLPEVPDDEDIIDQLPHLVKAWKNNIRVLPRIPKGARVAAAEAFCTLVDQVTDLNSIFSWARLFGFAYSALRRPPKSSSTESNQPSLTSIVRRQINNYIAAPKLPAHEDVNNNTPGRSNRTEVPLAKRVSAKLADCDIKGAVRIISSLDTFAGYGDEVTRALQNKHPAAPDNVDLPPAPDADTPPFQATREQVVNALRSFPTSSGSGLDGIRPSHLVSMTSKGSGAAGERLKTSLTNLCNHILSGEVPAQINPLFFWRIAVCSFQGRRRHTAYCCRERIKATRHQGGLVPDHNGAQRAAAAHAAGRRDTCWL